MFAERIHRGSAVGCGLAIGWLSFERSFSNLLSGRDAWQVFTAGQSLCEFSVGMVIERRTLFQHANQGKWGFLPIGEYVGISGWPGRDGGGNGPEVLSQKNGVNKMRNKSFQLLELFWFIRRRILRL